MNGPTHLGTTRAVFDPDDHRIGPPLERNTGRNSLIGRVKGKARESLPVDRHGHLVLAAAARRLGLDQARAPVGFEGVEGGLADVEDADGRFNFVAAEVARYVLDRRPCRFAARVVLGRNFQLVFPLLEVDATGQAIVGGVEFKVFHRHPVELEGDLLLPLHIANPRLDPNPRLGHRAARRLGVEVHHFRLGHAHPRG